MKRSWVDNLLGVMIVGAIAIIFAIMFKIVSHGKEPVFVTYQQAGCNMTVYILQNAEAYYDARSEFNRRIKGGTLDEVEKMAKELEEKEKAQEARKALEETYKRLFGYVPSETEICLLKGITHAESGNTEPLGGIERVIEVIANRCRSSRFPNTIYGVVTQRNQFETYSNRTYQRGHNERVEEAWNNVLRRGRCLDEAVLFFTAGKYNSYCRPGYVIGHHYFGY